MGLARSTYYGARPGDRDAEILARVEAICAEFEAYGYRRITAELRHQGQVVNSKRVRRLMREHDLQPKQRHVATTNSDHDEPIFPNLAADMVPEGPNQLWVADITSLLRPHEPALHAAGIELADQLADRGLPFVFVAVVAGFEHNGRAAAVLDHGERHARHAPGVVVRRMRDHQ